MKSRPSAPEREEADGPARDRGHREISSEALLAGGKEVLIRHQGEAYRLRLTRQNKLILTK